MNYDPIWVGVVVVAFIILFIWLPLFVSNNRREKRLPKSRKKSVGSHRKPPSSNANGHHRGN